MLTDNEIIQALECHKDETNSCQECAYNGGRGCSLRLAADVLDLINHQKAEIERLIKEKYPYIGDVFDEVKIEAIKEFAAKLKRTKRFYRKVITEEVIDNLVKEMVGDEV